MRSQNITTKRKEASLSINIQIHRAEAEETTDISWQKSGKRIYKIIDITSRIPSHLHIKEEQNKITVCGLSTTEQHYNKKLILSITDWQNTRLILRNNMVHSARPARGLPPYTDKGRRQMEDSLSDKVWTVWISCHAIQAHKCTSITTDIAEQHFIWVLWWFLHGISGWHSDIYQRNKERPHHKSQEDLKETGRLWSTTETVEMKVSQEWDDLLRTCHNNQRNQNGGWQSTGDTGLAVTNKCHWGIIFSQTIELLPVVHKEFFRNSETLDWAVQKGYRVHLDT